MEHKPCIYKCPTNLRIVSHNYPLKQGAKSLQIWSVQSDKSVAKKVCFTSNIVTVYNLLKASIHEFWKFFLETIWNTNHVNVQTELNVKHILNTNHVNVQTELNVKHILNIKSQEWKKNSIVIKLWNHVQKAFKTTCRFKFQRHGIFLILKAYLLVETLTEAHF